MHRLNKIIERMKISRKFKQKWWILNELLKEINFFRETKFLRIKRNYGSKITKKKLFMLPSKLKIYVIEHLKLTVKHSHVRNINNK